MLLLVVGGATGGYWVLNKKEIKKYKESLYCREQDKESITLNDDTAWKLM